MSKEIEERWAGAKLIGKGRVYVPGIDDPRKDVKALLKPKAKPAKKKASTKK